MANKAFSRFKKRWSKALAKARTFRNKEEFEILKLICENAPPNTRGGIRYWLNVFHGNDEQYKIYAERKHQELMEFFNLLETSVNN